MSAPLFNHETTGDEVVAAYSAHVKGRVFLLTGPSTTGIGGATLLSLARASPAVLILVGRTPSKLQPLVEQIRAIDPAVKALLFQAELSSLASVRIAANAILASPDVPHIDVLINNAAIMACPYELTVDGIESQFAVNHLSHFLLAALLAPKLRAAPNPTIVNVSSNAHGFGTGDYEDYNYERTPYDPWLAYGQGKTANLLFARSLADKFGAQGLRAFSLHPGSIRSGLQKHVTPDLLESALNRAAQIPGWTGRDAPKSYEQGCSTTLVAALDPTLPNGAYLTNCQVAESTAASQDMVRAEKLWLLSEMLVGEPFKY